MDMSPDKFKLQRDNLCSILSYKFEYRSNALERRFITSKLQRKKCVEIVLLQCGHFVIAFEIFRMELVCFDSILKQCFTKNAFKKSLENELSQF